MTSYKPVKLRTETLAAVDAAQERIRANHPQRLPVPRQALVNEVLLRALKMPAVLRDIGASVRRQVR